MAGNREKDWGKKKHFREGQAKQILDDLFFDYLSLVERLNPKVVIAENVKGMITGNAKWYVKQVFDRFKELGYRPQLFLVNAADCGVPQKRERVFFVALRNDICKPRLILNPKLPWVSAGEATKDLQKLTTEEIKDTHPTKLDLMWWHKTKKGEAYCDVIEREKGKSALWNNKKISDTEPCNTLASLDALFTHWSECRKLTYREWKRLGSFPDDYQAKTDKIGKYMIGTSVPPKMMYEVAKEVVIQWF